LSETGAVLTFFAYFFASRQKSKWGYRGKAPAQLTLYIMRIIIKVLLSSVTIVAITEISKRSTLIGSIVASIPIVSLLAFIWMYIDTKDTVKIAELSQGIFWLVIPSLVFFMLFPAFLKKNVDFWLSLGISLIVMIIAYFIMLFVLKKVGINI
jgi:hypothetical protein